MAVRSREEIISEISARVSGDNSDEVIALIEDVTDTLQDLETRANGDGTDWKAEAERIDKEWREKYISRFTSGSDEADNITNSKLGVDKTYSFEQLFKEGD